LKRAAALALACFASLAGAQFKSDWEEREAERNWAEGAVTLPAFPKREDLIEFFVSSASDFKFFIDRASLAVGADGYAELSPAPPPDDWQRWNAERDRGSCSRVKVG